MSFATSCGNVLVSHAQQLFARRWAAGLQRVLQDVLRLLAAEDGENGLQAFGRIPVAVWSAGAEFARAGLLSTSMTRWKPASIWAGRFSSADRSTGFAAGFFG